MARKRYTPETIIRKLREAEVLQGQGKTIAEMVKQLGVTEQTDALAIVVSEERGAISITHSGRWEMTAKAPWKSSLPQAMIPARH